MNKNTDYELKGWICKGTGEDDSSGLSIDAVLNDVGYYGVQVMKEKTIPYNASGRLTDSIMYRTNKKSSANSGKYASEDKLSAVTEDNEVDIGSNAPHAVYRETYSGIHRNSDKSELFISNLKEWVRNEIGVEPDDMSMGKAIFETILKEIRDHDTPGKPFVETSVDEIIAYAKTQLQSSINIFIETMNRKGGK